MFDHMKQQEIKNKDRKELMALLAELQGKLNQLSFELAEKKVKDVSQIGKTKKDIARVLTELSATK